MKPNAKPVRIKCIGVPYRQGWIEVVPGIHPGFVNLEAWHIVPDLDISVEPVELGHLPDGSISGNVELELNLVQARELVRVLQEAIGSLDQDAA